MKGNPATLAALKTEPQGGVALSSSMNGGAGEAKLSSDQWLELQADALSMKDNNVQVQFFIVFCVWIDKYCFCCCCSLQKISIFCRKLGIW